MTCPKGPSASLQREFAGCGRRRSVRAELVPATSPQRAVPMPGAARQHAAPVPARAKAVSFDAVRVQAAVKQEPRLVYLPELRYQATPWSRMWPDRVEEPSWPAHFLSYIRLQKPIARIEKAFEQGSSLVTSINVSQLGFQLL